MGHKCKIKATVGKVKGSRSLDKETRKGFNRDELRMCETLTLLHANFGKQHKKV